MRCWSEEDVIVFGGFHIYMVVVEKSMLVVVLNVRRLQTEEGMSIRDLQKFRYIMFVKRIRGFGKERV